MPSIITVTPNPCIDISALLPKLIPDKKLHCSHVKREPGGGGINVSRVITRLGGDTKAIFFAGGYTGEFLQQVLKKENVDCCVIKTIGHTRENVVMKESSTGLQYKFGMPGPEINEFEWHTFLDKIEGLPPAGYIVASGSLTAGIPTDFFARIAFIAKQKKIRLIMDTSGEALKAALEEGVYLIKPNLGELASLSGIKDLNKDTAIEAARCIINKKQCKIVVVSMGAQGALLVSDSIAEYVNAPRTEIKSTVGAGDSMVAGLVLALSRNMSFKEALQYGVACGTATTMNEGTALCDPGDVASLFGSIALA